VRIWRTASAFLQAVVPDVTRERKLPKVLSTLRDLLATPRATWVPPPFSRVCTALTTAESVVPPGSRGLVEARRGGRLLCLEDLQAEVGVLHGMGKEVGIQATFAACCRPVQPDDAMYFTSARACK
jgi:hypothetical protein